MVEKMDQLFIWLAHWCASFVPSFWQPVVIIVLGVIGIICVFPALFAIAVLLERKGLGRMQNRYGPNRVGWFGVLQPVADAVKSLTKEDIVPYKADALLHFMAPVLLVVVVFMGYAVLPIGRGMTLVHMDAALLFYFAVGATAELSVFMAGWASHNKYSLLGAMRAISQMISYEVPLLLSTIPIVMVTGSLSLDKMVEAQNQYTFGLPHWYIFTPWGFAGFILFVIAAMAETNRSPFDLPEGESELVAGYFTEYSGFKFAEFFLGEYVGMLSISGLGATLFWGGWSAPIESLQFIPSWAWFVAKVMAAMCFFIWVRGTLPRIRQDQLMNFAWKFMLPLALVNIFVTATWRVLGDGWQRWVVCAGVLLVVYVGLCLSEMKSRSYGPRKYRYAE